MIPRAGNRAGEQWAGYRLPAKPVALLDDCPFPKALWRLTLLEDDGGKEGYTANTSCMISLKQSCRGCVDMRGCLSKTLDALTIWCCSVFTLPSSVSIFLNPEPI